MVSSLLSQMKAKAQHLSKEYQKLQAEVRVAKNAQEAIRKTKEADKIFSEVNRLHSTIARLEAKEKSSSQTLPSHKPTLETEFSDPGLPQMPSRESQKTEGRGEISLEERIGKLEESQKNIADKVKYFALIKEQLLSLKEEAEKHAIYIAQQSHVIHEKLEFQIEKLNEEIQFKDSLYKKVKQNANLNKGDAHQQVELLKKQLNQALEKQQQLEQNQKKNGGFWKGFWVGGTLSFLSMGIFIGFVMATPWWEKTINRKCPSSYESPSLSNEQNRYETQ